MPGLNFPLVTVILTPPLPPRTNYVHVSLNQLSTLTELLKASRGALEASQRREAAAVSEVERTNAKEARRLEQLQALLASACSSGATGAIGATRGNDGVGVFSIEEARTRTVGGRPRRRGAACELSELAALEETIVERAREVTSLKVWCTGEAVE